MKKMIILKDGLDRLHRELSSVIFVRNKIVN